jgi:hypothetical protein
MHYFNFEDKQLFMKQNICLELISSDLLNKE